MDAERSGLWSGDTTKALGGLAWQDGWRNVNSIKGQDREGIRGGVGAAYRSLMNFDGVRVEPALNAGLSPFGSRGPCLGDLPDGLFSGPDMGPVRLRQAPQLSL